MTETINREIKQERPVVVVNRETFNKEFQITLDLGEIYYADLGEYDASTHKQGGIRPVIVAQQRKVCATNNTVWVIPLTTKIKATYLPVHVVVYKDNINHLSKDSMAVVEQIVKIPKSSFIGNKVGMVNSTVMKELSEAINSQFPF